MPRDYKSHATRKKKKSLPGYVWLLSGLGIGLFVAFIIYLDKQPENETAFGDAVQLELEKLKQQAAQNPTVTKQPKKQSEKQKAENTTQEKKEQKFNFYTLLPQLEVLIPESETRPPEVKPQHKPAINSGVSKKSDSRTNSKSKFKKSTNSNKNKRYVLQVGSFQNLNDAEKLKANLAFMGVTTSIQHVTVNKQSWHRVRSGPYNDKQQLYKNQQKLKRNNISSIPMELK